MRTLSGSLLRSRGIKSGPEWEELPRLASSEHVILALTASSKYTARAERRRKQNAPVAQSENYIKQIVHGLLQLYCSFQR